MNNQESISFAKKYLEDLLSFFGLNTEVSASGNDDEIIELNIPSTHLNGFLIGQHGDTLYSLQLLVSTTLKNNNAQLNRVNIDVANYKRQRNDRLSRKITDIAKKVLDSGEPHHLEPMNALERRIAHQAISELSGLETESEGEGRDRHVVIRVCS
jgi:spoIIIJ-associated protein